MSSLERKCLLTIPQLNLRSVADVSKTEMFAIELKKYFVSVTAKQFYSFYQFSDVLI